MANTPTSKGKAARAAARRDAAQAKEERPAQEPGAAMPQETADPQPTDNEAAVASQETFEPQQTESDPVNQQNTIASADSEQLEQEETTDAPAERKEDVPLSPATTYAGSPAEAAARAAETAAAAETRPRRTVAAADALTAKGRQILKEYPAAAEVYMTSNGFGFFREQDARNHATTLRDKKVIIVKRK